MTAIPEIVHWQKVKIVHYGHKMRGSHNRHLILLRVKRPQLLIVLGANLLHQLSVSWTITLDSDFSRILDHDSLYSLVAQHRAYAASARLLEPMHSPRRIIPRNV